MTLLGNSADTLQSVISGLINALHSQGKKIYFVRVTDCLDIDTPGKDSYALFAAGLDYAMLVTDKQCYLKSRHDISKNLPIPLDSDWVLQDGEVYPSDICFQITEWGIMLEDRIFSAENLNELITYLIEYE
ncbi:MAG: molybdopterin-guanine dinucleotide biosynthesis protein MobB [Ostreibacterium sp.]